MKGRRVALLLTGVLPLLAEDDIPAAPTIPEAVSAIVDTNDENDDVSELHNAAKALHEDEALRTLPALPFDLLEYDRSSKGLMLVDSIVMDDEESQQCLLDVYNFTAAGNGTGVCCKVGDDAEKDKLPGDTSSAGSVHDTDAGVVSSDGTAHSESVGDESLTASEEEDDEASPERALMVDYASKSAGGLVLESSPAMSGTSNLLNSDKDKYAIAPCEERKKVVIGLSEDILVKQVKLANYERYSSKVETFQVLGSQTMGNWVDLGTYTAESQNGEQAFDLKEPAWARYLTFRFISHYGSEHYCTVSQIKVHGSTMLQGFHEQWQESEEETHQLDDFDEDDDVVLDATPTEAEQDHTDVADEAEESSPSEEDLSSAKSAEASPDDCEAALGTGSSQENDGTKADVPPSLESEEQSQSGSESTTMDTRADVNDENSTPESSVLSSENDKLQMALARKEVVSDSDQIDLPSEDTPLALPPASTAKAGSSGTTELGTDAIVKASQVTHAVASVVKNAVAEASGAIKAIKDAPTASNAILELQEKLKATNSGLTTDDEIDDPVGEVPSSIMNVTIEVSTELRTKVLSTSGLDTAMKDAAADDDSVPTEQIEEGQAHALSTRLEDNGRHADEIDSATSVSVQNGGTSFGSADGSDSRNGEKPVEESGDRDESSSQVDLDPSLAELLDQFPSAACMKNLNFSDFESKIVAARKGGSTSTPANAGAGRLEPIFKTLTDEIKSLQINNSAQKQYSKALVSCYQQIMVNLMSELDGLQRQHDVRLADLERAVRDLQSKGLITAWDDIANRALVICSVVLGLLSRCAQFLWEGSVAKEGFGLLGWLSVVVGVSLLVVFAVPLRSTTSRPSNERIRDSLTKPPVPDPPAPKSSSLPSTPTLVDSIETMNQAVKPHDCASQMDPSTSTPACFKTERRLIAAPANEQH